MGVSAAAAADVPRAGEIARVLALPLLPAPTAPRQLAPGGLLLRVERGRTLLCVTGPRAPGPVGVDFGDPGLRHRRRGGQNELLGRAVGWRRDRAPAVLDATAGFARDAFVLADLGCRLLLCEREPLLQLLLGEALQRAAAGGGCEAPAAARMQLAAGDARHLDADRIAGYEVIYLDPMFAQPRRGAAGKGMQLLAQLLAARGTVDDSAALLAWARRQPVRRVVVKRPRKAPALPGPAPGHSLQGRAVRFDVYPLPRRGGADAD